MADSNRVEIKGSVRVLLPVGADKGLLPADDLVQVSVLLRHKTPVTGFPWNGLQGGHPPIKKKYLTRNQFASAHGASEPDIQKIRDFAKQHNLNIVTEHQGSRTVKLSGSAANINSAFGVVLRKYDTVHRSFESAITVPSDLDRIVEGVFGLDNHLVAKPHFRIRTTSTATPVSYSPLQVKKAYRFPLRTGAGQTIAILELGGGYNQSDLMSFFGNLKIKQPTIIAVPVDGASNLSTNDPNGPDAEVELDIQVSGSIAPKAKIAVYFAPNTDQGFIDGLSAAVHDTVNKPDIISISWGGPENEWTAQTRNAINSICQDASVLGITILVASGDNGADDSTTAKVVDFPASSPYVIACGGTKLILSGTKLGTEVVWNESASQEGASGGGVSEAFVLPSYQTNAKVPKAPNGFIGRGSPDVAGNADPETGYNVYVDGSPSVIGGTSAVAPLWAGLIALINQSIGTNVGFVNPLLYQVKSGFNDIIEGNNNGYTAEVGWDACTGLGSPNGLALLAALKASLVV